MKQDDERNYVDELVETFAKQGADSVGVHQIETDGLITVEPLNSKTGRSWSMSVITDIEEVANSKYQKYFRSDKDFEKFGKCLRERTK